MDEYIIKPGQGYFFINDNKYPKGLYQILNNGHRIIITNQGGHSIVKGDVSKFKDAEGNGFETIDDLSTYLDAIFKVGGGGGEGATTDASQLTSGILPSARIGNGSITEEKLSNNLKVNSTEFSAALDFTRSKSMADLDQSGAVVFTLLTPKVGNTVAVKVKGDGLSTCTFSPNFKVFGAFDNTKVNYLTFYCHTQDEVWVTILNGEDVAIDGVNLLSNSENFSTSPFTKDSGLDLVPYNGADPFGSNRATTMISWTTGAEMLKLDLPVITGQHTFSFYAKAGTKTSFNYYLVKPDLSGFELQGNFSTQGAGSSNGSGTSVDVLPNGWFRFSHTFSTASTGSLKIWIHQSAAEIDSTIHIFGFQLNPGATADPYIKKP